MDSPFLNEYGLLNSKIGEGVAENSPLWSWEYLLMKKDAKLFSDLISFIELSKTDKDGLYNQRPFKTGTGDDYMSPDQLIAFTAALHRSGRKKELKAIWKFLRNHLFTYDNLEGKINYKRFMQPSVIFFIAALMGKWWAKPFLIPLLMHSSYAKRNETSGRLKAWTMMETLGMVKTKKLCTKIIQRRSKFITWSGSFLEYFKEENHPIRYQVSSREV